MKTLFAVILAGVVLAPFECLSQGNLVENGSFENGYNNGPVGWGWTINVGLGIGIPGAADGTSLAVVYGTLFQNLATTPGQEYRVRYAVSGNSSFPGVSVVGFSWGGNFIGDVTWTSPNTAGNGLNFNWTYGDYTVIANQASTQISFQGRGTSWQPSLDAVSVTAVPEPSTLPLSVLGLSMLGGFALRRINHAA